MREGERTRKVKGQADTDTNEGFAKILEAVDIAREGRRR